MNQGFVTIPQINGEFFNALPYSVNWNFNDGTSPSTLTVNLIREDGVYNVGSIEASLGYSRIYNISIGNGFNFVGYLTDYSIEKTPEQKLLTLEYTDLGADLDRYYVGLNKKYGNKSNNSSPNLILVGKEYHPCDPNLDSSVPSSSTAGLAVDPCDPCPFMPQDKYKLACDPGMASFNIYEVFYTFNELIAQLPIAADSSGIIVDNQFRAQHVGKLKDVLSAWCSALGYAYYWDPLRNQLIFINRRLPISIPDPNYTQQANASIIDFKYGATVKSTYSRGFLGYFSKEGAVHDYTCAIDPYNSFVDTKPLTLLDIIDTSDGGTEFSGGGYTYADKVQITTALSYYSRALRDSWLWFEYWGITDDSSAQQAAGQTLPDFGNMVIKDVFSPNAKSNVYVRLTSPDVLSIAQLTSLAGKNFYFIVAKQDDDLAEKQFHNVEGVAKGFLGKYWYAYYNTPIPGGSNDKSNITAETADGGSAEWHLAGTNITSLPIFGFGYKPSGNSKLGQFAKQVAGDESANNNTIQNLQSQGGNNQTGPQDIALTSFILAQRDAKWSPSDDQISWYQSLFQWNQDMLPKMVGVDGRPDILFDPDIAPYAKTDTSIKLFLVVEYPGDYNFSQSNAQHPNEYTSPKKKTKVEQDSLGNPITLYYGNYGLRNSTTTQITVPGMTITLPVGAFGTSDSPSITAAAMGSWSNQSSSSPTYTVFVNASQSFKKVLPKIEVSAGWAAETTNVAQIDYHYKEAREDNLDLVNGGKLCTPANDNIYKYFEPLANNAVTSQSSPQRKMSFKLPGIFPAQYSVGEGLVGIQISLTSNGFFTSYSFEDRIIQPPSDEYIMESVIAKTIARGHKGDSHVVGNNSQMVGRSLGFA